MTNLLLERWVESGGRRWPRPGEDPLEFVEQWMKAHWTREMCTKTLAWAVPDEKAIQICVDNGPLIEIGAGLGYWAMLIQQQGGDIRPYDRTPAWSGRVNNHVRKGMVGFTHVYLGGPPKIRAKINAGRTLLLCWPPYGSDMAVKCLRHEPRKLIYVGEGHGGCCADDAFFEELSMRYELVMEHYIPHGPTPRWRR